MKVLWPSCIDSQKLQQVFPENCEVPEVGGPTTKTHLTNNDGLSNKNHTFQMQISSNLQRLWCYLPFAAVFFVSQVQAGEFSSISALLAALKLVVWVINAWMTMDLFEASSF